MKQTAVQFLFENIVITSSKNLVNIIKQSIEMEKEQIIDAFNEGYFDEKSAEQYYDETFKSEQDNE